MKVLLDEHLTHELRGHLYGHDVFSVHYMKWDGVRNGALLAKAAATGFDVLLTNDGGIGFEQNRGSLPCSVLFLGASSNAPEVIIPLAPKVLRALSILPPRTYMDLSKLD